ncbi:GAF domain-containing protein, partial [Streptomyces sp. NPDC056730]
MSEESHDGEAHGDREGRGEDERPGDRRPGEEHPDEEHRGGDECRSGERRGDGGATAPRLPTLLEAVLGIGTDLELRATLQHIVDTAAELIGARYGALGVLDPERGGLTELFTAGLSDAGRQRIGRLPDGDTGVLGLLIKEPRPLRLDDLTADPRSAGVPPGHPVMRSFLGVPLQLDST